MLSSRGSSPPRDETPVSFVSKGGFPGDASGQEPAYQCRRQKRQGFHPWEGKIPWRRAWQLPPIFLPEESQEQRSLAGYIPWSHKESNMTEQLSFHFIPQGASQVVLVVKNLPANPGDTKDVGLIPGSGRFPGEGSGYPLQYSCLENFMDRRAWWSTVPGVAKSRTRLSD